MKIIILILLCFTCSAEEYVRKTQKTEFAKGRYHKPLKSPQNTLQRTNRIPIPEPKKKPKYYKSPNKNRWVFRDFSKKKKYYSDRVNVKGHYRNGKWVKGHTRRRPRR